VLGVALDFQLVHVFDPQVRNLYLHEYIKYALI